MNSKKIFNTKIIAYFYFLKKFPNFSLLLFILDVIIYSSLNKYIGINMSLFLGFVVTQILLFTLLRKTMISKFKSKINGLLKQFVIALISLLIHASVINLFYFFNNKIQFISVTDQINHNYIISLVLKLICGLLGIINSSILINRFLFKVKS